jgi:type VI secretion system protein ImpK
MTTNEVSSQTRSENLAFVFQEILTAIIRLRTNRQAVSDSALFRTQIRDALTLAVKEATKLGYSPETVRLGVFAVVAFLDESVLNQQVPAFADWASKPLQEELFGVHVAGEIFFENLRRLLGQTDSVQLADVLELHQLCLLLGYRGRYGTGARGELKALIDAVEEKIRRIRGAGGDLSPAWAVPRDDELPSQSDRWARPILFAFVGCLSIALLLFIGFRVLLGSGINALTAVVSEVRR